MSAKTVFLIYLFSYWLVIALYLPGEQDKEERWAEVQKKITPWRLEIQEQEPELQLVPPQRAVRLGKLHGSLLVVASLIDKSTNLGGQAVFFYHTSWSENDAKTSVT